MISMITEWSLAYRAAAVIAFLDACCWIFVIQFYLRQLPVYEKWHAEVTLEAAEKRQKFKRIAASGQRPM